MGRVWQARRQRGRGRAFPLCFQEEEYIWSGRSSPVMDVFIRANCISNYGEKDQLVLFTETGLVGSK